MLEGVTPAPHLQTKPPSAVVTPQTRSPRLSSPSACTHAKAHSSQTTPGKSCDRSSQQHLPNKHYDHPTHSIECNRKKLLTLVPVEESQTTTSLSDEPLTVRLPSGEESTEHTKSECPATGHSEFTSGNPRLFLEQMQLPVQVWPIVTCQNLTNPASALQTPPGAKTIEEPRHYPHLPPHPLLTPIPEQSCTKQPHYPTTLNALAQECSPQLPSRRSRSSRACHTTR